jgi:glycosyltransferase involved in cell wall biosynthesis
MNILFIGPYRQSDSDGWKIASVEYIKALATISDINLSIRPIYMTNRISPNLDPDLIEYEYNNFDHYDVVIQNCLPHFFDYNGNIKKNIGLFFTETDQLQYHSWPSRCNLMDELWCPSSIEKDHLITSCVTKPIHPIGIPVDIEKFNKKYDKIDLQSVAHHFIFYTISEFTDRKNLRDLIISFHLEFGINEPVSLMIKTGLGNNNPELVSEKINKEILDIKTSLRIYAKSEQYKKDILITQNLPAEALNSVHVTGDCFVTTSCGEAFCMPALDALGFGNPVITTKGIGTNDFVSHTTNGYIVNSTNVPVIVKDPPIADLYTARETFKKIDVLELRRAMRKIYENNKEFQLTQISAKETVKEFSYEKVGQKIWEILKQ